MDRVIVFDGHTMRLVKNGNVGFLLRHSTNKSIEVYWSIVDNAYMIKARKRGVQCRAGETLYKAINEVGRRMVKLIEQEQTLDSYLSEFGVRTYNG